MEIISHYGESLEANIDRVCGSTHLTYMPASFTTR